MMDYKVPAIYKVTIIVVKNTITEQGDAGYMEFHVDDAVVLGGKVSLDDVEFAQSKIDEFRDLCSKLEDGSTVDSDKRKVLVDLALRVGINEYRFVSYDITDKGQIVRGSSEYVTPREGLVKLANSFILKEPEILSNSMLPNESKEELYDKICT